MITKPIIKGLIEEYESLVDHLSRYIDKYDYQDSEIQTIQGRISGYKEYILKHSGDIPTIEANTVSIKDINAEISKELNKEE
tara:strand:+ start:177 stop:422 length:246 start_codon:yes stop_codon:yes gene_type:complete